MLVITNVLTREGRFYPVVSLQKDTVTVMSYQKNYGKYYDTKKTIPVSNIREVFINIKGGYWKPIHTCPSST